MKYIIAVPGENFLTRAGEKYIDIDKPSGGYPYLVDDPGRAHTWDDLKEVEQYLDMFSDSKNYGLDMAFICTLEYTIKPI